MKPVRLKNVSLGSLAAGLILLFLSTWLYWPGVTGPDLLDDRTSVMVGGDLSANPDEILDFILGDRSGLLGRSVSMTTFAVEKLYLNEGMAGSKKVNIVLHAANAALLMLLCGLLFRHQSVARYQWLAVVLGGIWLLHPLLVSSVLYVVQRMAMMATFFMLLTMLYYVYWRLAVIASRRHHFPYLVLSLLLVLGLLAKENAIVVVPILLVLEVLWFRFEGPDGRSLSWLRFASWGLIVVGAAVLATYFLLFYDSLEAAFRGRQFTLQERLFTQLRIVWDYVAQWFLPDVHRMGLYHDDFPLSRSFTEPLSTTWALLAWLVLGAVCVAMTQSQDGRLFAFGVAWFLLAHSVESTVIPLELYFEHRNYFPAMGLMLAVGAIYSAVVRRWPVPGPPLLVLFAFLLPIAAGMTSSQVQVWSSRPLLVLGHLNGHPQSFRANVDMASEMARLGEVQAAHQFSRKAHEGAQLPAAQGERWGDYQLRNLALACIAGADVPEEDVHQLGTVHPQRPFSSVTTLQTLVRILQDDACPGLDEVQFADRMGEIFLVDDFRKRGASHIFSNLAVLENALGRYDRAFAYAEKFLAFSPNNSRGLLMKLHFAKALNRPDDADDAISRLQALDRQGKLTVGEQKTLALYL